MKISLGAIRYAVVCIVLLSVSSCVELTGQRITLFYDAGKDQLLFLINYDGIHDNKDRNASVGAEQIPEFIKSGDIMLLDWVGRIKMDEIREFAGNDTSQPRALLALAEAVAKNVKSIPVGHYRDPDGRIGAAQLVVISEAKELVRRANAALNEAILAATGPLVSPDRAPDAEMRMTVERMRPGALQGRQWIAIEGHSLRYEFPAQPAEWVRAKFKTLKGICERWAELAGQAQPSDDSPYAILQLATSSVTFQESAEGVVVRLGTQAHPSTFRFVIRDKYEPSLEQVVAQNVPEDLDAALSRGLSSPGQAVPSPVVAVREWGPPEEKVRALLGLLEAKETKDEALQKAPIEQLDAIAAAWNRDEPFPTAPRFKGDAPAYINAWKVWYRNMQRYPACDL